MKPLEKEKIYKTVCHSEATGKLIIGYCKNYKKFITKNQMKQHHCLRVKNDQWCDSFVKIDCEFWQLREEKKLNKKLRKQNK